MKKILFVTFLFILITLLAPKNVFAQGNSPIQKYLLGKVEKIVEEQTIFQDQEQFYTQKVQIKRLDNNQEVSVDVGTQYQPLNDNQRLRTGSTVILAEQKIADDSLQIVVVDIYRAPTFYWLLGLFFVLVIIVARWQGLLSIIGMLVSLLVLTTFIVPHILSGDDPILIAMIGSAVIAALSIYLCHGWSIKSHLALLSILTVLAAVALLSKISVSAAQVVGLGSEEAYYLQFGSTSKINLQGLLLAGILLGALGVLDDICIAQIAIVFELKALKKDINIAELYARALDIGRDHVASLVNTLILAYAGANLPLFILFTINKQVPMWVTLNSEIILEEVIRTLTGSIGLVLAVPLSTLVAALVVERLSEKTLKSLDHHSNQHSH
ncbi:MAG: YibE/F family protein [Patescibacteria group bacterium]